MGNIVLLDDLTINKIAAGEVIERPASVVKELVENSIDAGADNISIEIKNGGISYIRITDNGKGIAEDDLEIAFERHATSKIRNAEDLSTVKSMGFRGEALASIAAIARVELVTKTEDSEVGHKIIVEGGEVLSKEEVGCPKGTTITVQSLFYNTPVRYKFLKKDFTESGYIEDAISRIALVNPNIAIKYINSGKVVIQTSGNGEIKDVVYGIYGKDIAENIINVEYYFEDMAVKGIIGKPEIARSNRSNQLFFVNKRYVKDKTLTSAAEQAFKGLLPIGKYGFLILNLEIDPQQLDVNVHPAKLEVRFQEENKIFKLVYHAIKEAFLKVNIGVTENTQTNNNDGFFQKSYIEDLNSNDNLNNTYFNSTSLNNKDLNTTSFNNTDLKLENEKLDEFDNSFESRLERKLENKKLIDDSNNKKADSNVHNESKGFGSFLKNILGGSKNEFSSNDDNLVEQLYRDKMKREYDEKLENENSDTANGLSKNVELQNASENNSEHTNDSKNETEFQSSSNLERLIKELDANLEKINMSHLSNNLIKEEQVTETNTTNINNNEPKVEQVQENNVNNTVSEVNINNDLGEAKSEVNTDETAQNKSSEAVDETTQNKEEDLNNDDLLKKQNTEKKSVDGNTKELVLVNKIQNNNNDISFEEMYEKMFGTSVVKRDKVEEDQKGYSVKQEDLKTVENLSLFTQNSFYNRPIYKYIGIVFGLYIVIEYENEMYIVNQRYANERIIYEKVKKNFYSDTDKDAQLMLLPDIINLSEKQMGIAKENMEMFKKAGFDLEEFGENTIRLSGVPNICIELDTKQLFIDLLDEINTVARTARQEVEDKFISTVACKAAEKSAIALTAQEVDNLMQQLLSLPHPFVSPNGEPTAIRMSKIDIEKKFSRR